jgi:transcriptional regulator with XRE-family HTH domain
MENGLGKSQVRAARALLRWSQHDLAERAGVTRSTVADFERGARRLHPNNARALRTALEAAGINLTAGGATLAAATATLGS